MDLETVVVTSSGSDVRHPRGLVKVDNEVVDGWIDFTVSSNSFYEADTFRVSYAASALPQEHTASWFLAKKEIFVEVLAGFPTDFDHPDPAELDSLIYGRVDEIEFDPLEQILTLSGRDLTAVFIDNKITDEYVNQVATEIVLNLARSHGLESFAVRTLTKVGTYYDQDQVHLHASRSEWDLLTYLARRENCVVYVSGNALYFQPNPTDTANAYDLVWQKPDDGAGSPVSNAIDISFTRNMTVAKGVSVTARSANFNTGKPVVESYPSEARVITPGKSSPFGHVQNFYFNMAAGHSPVEVEAFAKARYDEIVSHEMKLVARLPGDNKLSILTPIRVTGTETPADQTYFPRQIVRQMSVDTGYEMTVEAQTVSANIAPEL